MASTPIAPSNDIRSNVVYSIDGVPLYITSLTTGQTLVYNGTYWINSDTPVLTNVILTGGGTGTATLVYASSSNSTTVTVPATTATTDTFAVLGTAQAFTAAQTFPTSGIILYNPAGTFTYTFLGSAIAANRIITLPLITGTDTIAVLGLAQSFTAVQTFTSISMSGKATTYNGISTAGTGVPIVVATYASGSVTSSQSNVINYTPPASAGDYRVSAQVSTTSGTNTGTTTVTITHKSSAGVAITQLPPFTQSNSATLLTAATAASKTFSMIDYRFSIDNSQTAITVSFTIAGTVAAYLAATLEQLA